MKNKRQLIIIGVLILALVVAVFLYFQVYQRWPGGKDINIIEPTVRPNASGNETVPGPKEARDFVMEDVAQKIAQLSPEKPVLGGSWHALRFWFIDGSYSTFYVEYEDGHNLRQMLLTADLSQYEKSGAINYKLDAFFEPGESEWILKSGQDQKSSLPLILYEYNESIGRWTQRN